MDELSPPPWYEISAETVVTPSEPRRSKRSSLAVRAAVVTVIAGGLAAGSYGIASAASGNGAAGRPGSQALATASSSTPSKPSSGHAWSGGPHRFGDFGPGRGFGAGGTITAVTSTTITVKSLFGGTVTVTTNASTVYREGSKKVARSALFVGEQVILIPAGRPGGSSSGSRSSSSSRLVATVEIVEPHVTGKVVKMSGSQVLVSEQDGLDVTVNISSSTTYGEVGHSASIADLHVGTFVLVTGTLSSDHSQIDATTIQIVPASVAGRVTSVSGTTIMMKSFDGTVETVTTDSGTLFRKGNATATIAAVAKGDFVEAFGSAGAGHTFAALTVDVGLVGPPIPGGRWGFGQGGPGGFGWPGGPGGFGGGFGRPGGPGGAGPNGAVPTFGGGSGSGSSTL